jgi:hypothetical protein
MCNLLRSLSNESVKIKRNKSASDMDSPDRKRSRSPSKEPPQKVDKMSGTASVN